MVAECVQNGCEMLKKSHRGVLRRKIAEGATEGQPPCIRHRFVKPKVNQRHHKWFPKGIGNRKQIKPKID